MASKSLSSMAKPLDGIVVPSFKYRSADQSKVVNSTAAPVASTTFRAAGITSLPMPSPGTTAIRLLGISEKNNTHAQALAIAEIARHRRHRRHRQTRPKHSSHSRRDPVHLRSCVVNLVCLPPRLRASAVGFLLRYNQRFTDRRTHEQCH